jgi:hypothetical protein
VPSHIDLLDLPDGMYILKITNGKTYYHKRIIKHR